MAYTFQMLHARTRTLLTHTHARSLTRSLVDSPCKQWRARDGVLELLLCRKQSMQGRGHVGIGRVLLQRAVCCKSMYRIHTLLCLLATAETYYYWHTAGFVCFDSSAPASSDVPKRLGPRVVAAAGARQQCSLAARPAWRRLCPC